MSVFVSKKSCNSQDFFSTQRLFVVVEAPRD